MGTSLHGIQAKLLFLGILGLLEDEGTFPFHIASEIFR